MTQRLRTTGVGAARDQKKGLIALELELQMTMSCLTWVLGSEFQQTPSELLTSKSSALDECYFS